MMRDLCIVVVTAFVTTGLIIMLMACFIINEEKEK